MLRVLLIAAIALTLTVATAFVSPSAEARVKLTTLPDRERVIIRFEDTGQVLVEETRTITLAKGSNQIDFTWLGVQIDRASIQLLSADGKGLEVIRTTYPPGEANSLVWEVNAAAAGAMPVRIVYLIAGMQREVALRAVVVEDSGKPGKPDLLSLRIHQRLVNGSGESYDQATLKVSFGDLRDSPLLSGEVRQQLLKPSFDAVPFTRRYTYDPFVGEAVRVEYVLVNSADKGLGKGLLPAGKVRMFQATGATEAFLGEDWATPTPLGEELKLHIGDTKDVTVRRAVLASGRQEVVQRDSDGRPSLWHSVNDLRWEVENFADQPRTIDLIEHLGGQWDVINPVQTLEKRIKPEVYEPAQGEANPPGTLERKDAETLRIRITVPPMRRIAFTASLRQLNLH